MPNMRAASDLVCEGTHLIQNSADFGNNISGNLNDWDYTAPEGPGTMADFDCETSGGDWMLTVDDDAGGDVGTLNEWCVNIYEETDPLDTHPALKDRLAAIADIPLGDLAGDAPAITLLGAWRATDL